MIKYNKYIANKKKKKDNKIRTIKLLNIFYYYVNVYLTILMHSQIFY